MVVWYAGSLHEHCGEDCWNLYRVLSEAFLAFFSCSTITKGVVDSVASTFGQLRCLLASYMHSRPIKEAANAFKTFEPSFSEDQHLLELESSLILPACVSLSLPRSLQLLEVFL